MGQRVNIPVRVVRPTEDAPEDLGAERENRGVSPERANLGSDPTNRYPTDSRSATERGERVSAPVADDPETAASDRQDELRAWRERALRLQADMDNYRKRQQRLAQAEIQSERERLLGSFLEVVDDLERALAAQSADSTVPHDGDRGSGRLHSKAGLPSQADLYRGVQLTHRSAQRLLQKEGVESIEARNQPFDPNWHEAVASVPRNGHQVDPGTVIQVLQPGYRLGDDLLRPAKVVVAL